MHRHYRDKVVGVFVLDEFRAEDLFLEGRLLEEEKSKHRLKEAEMALLEKLNFVLENNFVFLH
jgi:asparaginyl-tRNA synthetase